MGNFVGLIVVFASLILVGLFFTSGYSQSIFNPPYLAFVLQLFFVFGIGLAVALVSAKSYIQTGALNILLLGSAILISSISFTVSAAVLTPEFHSALPANQAVIMGNVGVLISSLVLLVSAMVTWRGSQYNPGVSKKTMLVVSFLISIVTVSVISVFSVLNLFPVFLTSSGPTLLRLVVLALTTIFYFASSVLFGWQYVRAKSQVVYWFSLALALFGTAYLAGVLTIHLGSAMTWISRLALYLSGAFLLFALLGPEGKTEKQPYAAKWSEAFRSNQKQMETFFSKIGEGFAYCKIITDAEGKPSDWLYLDVNESYERINDAERNKVVGRKATEVLPGIREDPANWLNVYGNVALTGEPIVLESFSKDRNKWYHISAYSPQKGYFVSLFEDITERKKAEDALKASEERFRAVQENSLDRFTILKPFFNDQGEVVDFTLVYQNARAAKLTGHKPEELVGLRMIEVYPTFPQTHFFSMYKRAYETRQVVEFEDHYQADRVDDWFYVTVTPISDGIAITTQIITKRKKAEEALQESEQRWATTLASIGDAVIATDTSSKIIFLNSEAEELTGWKLSEASQKPIKEVFNIVNEQTRLEVENPIDRVLKEGMVVGLANHTVLIQKNGAEVPIDDSGAPIKDKDGKTTGVVLIFRDITERKKAEEATAKQAELIDLSPDAIIVRKLDGIITFWSKGAEKLYGWTKDEAIGQDINSLLKTELPQSLEAILNILKIEGKWSGEIVHVCKDRSKLVVQSYWLGQFGSDGKILEMLESNVDITERIQMQLKLEESSVRLEEYANQMEELANQRAAQLKDAERLAAIGATAGMVGHDIRNPLQAITGDIYLAKTELTTIPEGEEKKNIQESLAEIEKNVDYINKIVADLQDFARPLKPNTEETDLKLIIDKLLEKNLLPENVKVSVKVEARKVVADSTFINRILYNLVNNAVQAMPKGGKLTIRTYKEANDTIISVKDTGVGIPETVKGKLFTPMFTTKSKGQGFGLAVIKRMTESLGGTVSFESQEGKGTTFIVRLPPPQEPNGKWTYK